MQRGISVLAFFVPAFIMLVLFIIRGIYPFGDRSFLFSDMYHQYMPFLSEFVHKIKAGEGLFYSYNVGIGSNFLALYVYYLASPFNWLVFLLPEGLIMEFMSYLVILRIGLMGLTFSIYLRKVFGKEDPAALLFSTAYALSGYLAAYNWNVMWLDCLILLPLILLGAERLVREGKWGHVYRDSGTLYSDQLLHLHYDLYLSGAVFWNVFDHGILYHDGRAEQESTDRIRQDRKICICLPAGRRAGCSTAYSGGLCYSTDGFWQFGFPRYAGVLFFRV